MLSSVGLFTLSKLSDCSFLRIFSIGSGKSGNSWSYSDCGGGLV